jgi:hypothetical protein
MLRAEMKMNLDLMVLKEAIKISAWGKIIPADRKIRANILIRVKIHPIVNESQTKLSKNQVLKIIQKDIMIPR